MPVLKGLSPLVREIIELERQAALVDQIMAILPKEQRLHFFNLIKDKALMPGCDLLEILLLTPTQEIGDASNT